jgi:hypothetical protein
MPFGVDYTKGTQDTIIRHVKNLRQDILPEARQVEYRVGVVHVIRGANRIFALYFRYTV